MLGLYIHIPFCVSKCHYCDFYSVTDVPVLMDRYIDALLAEADSFRGMAFSTLYIGGGTPSILGNARLERLINGLSGRFRLENMVEATIEVNPESAGGDFLAAAVSLGIGRVSIGIQSLNDYELKRSGRIHSGQQALDAVDAAFSSGLKNVSADIILGLPGQTLQSLGDTLSVLIDTGIHHISAYCLSIEHGTVFSRMPPADLPGEEDQACLFESAVAILKAHGFAHYEISNFARPGFSCQHNLNYWRGGEYLGLGPAAASHIAGERFSNAASLERYLDGPLSIREGRERLDERRKVGEEAMLRLRLIEEGLDVNAIAGKYGQDSLDSLKSALDELAGRRMLIKEGCIYRISPGNVLTANSVFIDVIG